MPPSPRLSKALGAILGVHTGDSLGATLEFSSHSDIFQEYPHGLREIIGGGPFGWPAGHATDDTDLTRAVLLAYVSRSKETTNTKNTATTGPIPSSFDIATSAAEFSLKWLHGDWPGREKGSSPEDIGNATMMGLMRYAQTRDVKNAGAGQGNAGNGSLMRCIPTALFTKTREDRVRESMQISAITHDDGRCMVSCAVYNEIVAALLEGKTAEEAVEIGIQVAKELQSESVESAVKKGKGLSILDLARDGPGNVLPDGTSGFVLQSLTVGVAAVLDARSFEEVLVDVVRLGGDTDTNGAISGGLLGAREGVDGIPGRWLEKLQFRQEFEEYTRAMM
ncbi:ADP-ribosylglycohydrolase [Byssothecium circinans]|uniref:ADP-ribosylhydrolase ARH3 n=1 Tax=Byssothecium circinans TaxID=147558 RepID=A0A6A5U6C4_9PLEO|nr:ADP-ribosylglycohydrolase [Byssothecium circinans]